MICAKRAWTYTMHAFPKMAILLKPNVFTIFITVLYGCQCHIQMTHVLYLQIGLMSFRGLSPVTYVVATSIDFDFIASSATLIFVKLAN